MTKSSYLRCALLLMVAALAACNDKKISSAGQAEVIHTAIDNNDIHRLRSVTALPLVVREQEWATANDGYGFVLGPARQFEITTDDEFNRYFESSIKLIKIARKKIISEGIPLTMFSDELEEQKKLWNGLNLHLLVRGEGDVEHIILLGLEKGTHKLRAIYMN